MNLSITCKPNGMSVQRIVHSDFTTVLFTFEDANGGKLKVTVNEYDTAKCSHSKYPRIREEHAYISAAGVDSNVEQRARYPIFLQQMTDVDEWETRDDYRVA